MASLSTAERAPLVQLRRFRASDICGPPKRKHTKGHRCSSGLQFLTKRHKDEKMRAVMIALLPLAAVKVRLKNTWGPFLKGPLWVNSLPHKENSQLIINFWETIHIDIKFGMKLLYRYNRLTFSTRPYLLWSWWLRNGRLGRLSMGRTMAMVCSDRQATLLVGRDHSVKPSTLGETTVLYVPDRCHLSLLQGRTA